MTYRNAIIVLPATTFAYQKDINEGILLISVKIAEKFITAEKCHP